MFACCTWQSVLASCFGVVTPKVPDDAAMHRMWVVKADDLSSEVCTICRNQIPVLPIRPITEEANELAILLRASLDLKCVNCAKIGRSD